MSNTLQEFLATATPKAADELVAAFERIPEDRRLWSPEGKARTALDMVAECAILNGYTSDLIRTRSWSDANFGGYRADKDAAVAGGWEALHVRLRENTGRVIAALSEVPDDALAAEIEVPWEKSSLADVIAYPYWNMIYHQGQINYIASMLGCLP
jgi:hypothetical protein